MPSLIHSDMANDIYENNYATYEELDTVQQQKLKCSSQIARNAIKEPQSFSASTQSSPTSIVESDDDAGNEEDGHELHHNQVKETAVKRKPTNAQQSHLKPPSGSKYQEYKTEEDENNRLALPEYGDFDEDEPSVSVSTSSNAYNPDRDFYYDIGGNVGESALNYDHPSFTGPAMNQRTNARNRNGHLMLAQMAQIMPPPPPTSSHNKYGSLMRGTLQPSPNYGSHYGPVTGGEPALAGTLNNRQFSKYKQSPMSTRLYFNFNNSPMGDQQQPVDAPNSAYRFQSSPWHQNNTPPTHRGVRTDEWTNSNGNSRNAPRTRRASSPQPTHPSSTQSPSIKNFVGNPPAVNRQFSLVDDDSSVIMETPPDYHRVFSDDNCQ